MNDRTNARRPSLPALSLAALVVASAASPGQARDDGDLLDDLPIDELPVDGGRPDGDPIIIDDPIIDDPIARPPADPDVLQLTLHPKAAEILSGVVQGLSQQRINVALLGGEKFMIADCLGLKVSAGEFDLQLGYSTFSMGTWGVEFVFTIDHLAVSALKFRMQPRANLLDPCDWSGAFEAGGSVKDLRITVRFDPRLHLDPCYLVSLGDFEARVSIGDVNLSNVQNDLERAAKNLIEDSLTNALNVFLPSLLSAAINGSFLNGLCMTKLALYEAYMGSLGMGVTLHELPEEYIAGLQPFYPTVDLRDVKFGHSSRQPPGNTTTDCNRIYFNVPGIVDRLRRAELADDEWDLLFHELQHTEQCARLGSREEFAKLWFHDFELSALVLNLNQPSYYEQLHDHMPMEEEAFATEERIGVIAGTVEANGTSEPAPGVEVTAVVGSGSVGSPAEVAARDTSRSAGEFLLFLAPGSYDLHVRASGAAQSTLAKNDAEVVGGEVLTVYLELPAAGTTPSSPATFIRGDANASGGINISDALATLGWLFSGADAPPCLDAADATDDGTVNIADPLALLNHLFTGGPAPRAPFPAPGADPTADSLPCSG